MMLSLLISLVIAVFFCDSAYTFNRRRFPIDEINGSSSESTTPCEKGWYFIEDKCYKIEADEDDRTSWENASVRCSELGGKLASIHSKKHNDLLTAFLVMNVKQTVWIGLNDKDRESTFSWEDKTAFDYRNWELGQPDNENKNEHCVQLYADPFVDKVGKWNDFPCTSRLGYICQKDKKNSQKAPDLRFCSSDRGGGWKFRNSCYNIINESKSWDDAELYCQSTFKGHLVMISDLPRNFFLGVLLSNYKSGFWIGIKTQRMYQEKWSSGWPVAYGHFDRSLPAIESGTCILRMKSNLWISVNCTEVHPFICEINSKGPPILKQSTPKAHCPALPPGWRDFGGDYCYYIDTESLITWYGAQAICIRRGGLLVSINSKEEEELLHPFIRQKQASIFIGLNTFLTNGNLSLWSDGSVPSYTHWLNTEPYGYRPKCAEVKTEDMIWNIASCSSTAGYICQIKKITEMSVENEDMGENSTIIETTSVEEEINGNAEEEINEPDFRANGLNTSLEKLIPCEKGWYYFNETCYKIEGYTSEYPATTYTDASFRCSFLGGKLVSIHSKEENDFLTTYLILSNVKVMSGWIGLNDKERESNFTWEDESQVDYLNWNTGQPDNMKFHEDCVYLWVDPNSDVFGKWYDIPCNYKKPYICQKESNKTFQTTDPQFCSFGDRSGLKFRNICYNIISDPESWDDAELYCQSELNGHLVSILDGIHNHFFEIMLANFKSPLWIGIKTQNQYQQKWASGSPVAYSHFDMVLEDIPVGTCLIRWNENLWTTEDCAKKSPFICEINTDRHSVLPQPSQELHCPEVPHGWRDLGGEYCYYINTKIYYSWYEAQSRCISLGGLLATIHSKEIEQILHHFIKNTQERIFIGLNSLLTNGDIFFWSDGTQLNYTNWNEDEPNSSYERCGELWTHNMKWNDIACGVRKGFICQTKKVNNTNEANAAKVEKEVTTQWTTTKSNGEKIKEYKNITERIEDEPGVTKSEVKETTKYKEKEVNSQAPMKEATKENENKGNRDEVTRNATFDAAVPTRKASTTEKEEKHDVATLMAARSEEEETDESHAATQSNKEEKKTEGNDEITFPSNITVNLERKKAEESKEYAPSSTSGATARGLYVSLVFIAALLGIWAYYSRKWIKHKTNILATVFYRPSASFKELKNKWSAEIMLDKNGEETYM